MGVDSLHLNRLDWNWISFWHFKKQNEKRKRIGRAGIEPAYGDNSKVGSRTYGSFAACTNTIPIEIWKEKLTYWKVCTRC